MKPENKVPSIDSKQEFYYKLSYKMFRKPSRKTEVFKVSWVHGTFQESNIKDHPIPSKSAAVNGTIKSYHLTVACESQQVHFKGWMENGSKLNYWFFLQRKLISLFQVSTQLSLNRRFQAKESFCYSIIWFMWIESAETSNFLMTWMKLKFVILLLMNNC